jgi:hypothetical protein
MTRYRTPEGVLRAEVEGDEVLLNTETGIYHLVNPTGRELLERMDAGVSLDEAVRLVSERSGAEHARVARDAEVFVEAMCDRGLLEEVR